MRRDELAEQEWELLSPLIPRAAPGRPLVPDQQVINGMICKIRTGIPARDLPERYGPWQAVYTLSRRYALDGVFTRSLHHIQAKADASGDIVVSGRQFLQCLLARAWCRRGRRDLKVVDGAGMVTGRCWLQSCSWPRQAARGSSSRQRRSGRDRHRLHAGGLGRPRGVPPQHRTDRAEALRLLGSVLLGRIVFTQDALPAICPVNHLLHHGEVIIRTHEGAALTSLTERAPDEGVVVAYEADAIAPATYCGWSVVVTGYCHLVTDPDELAHYQALLHPWADHRMSYALRIRPDLVTGVRPSP